MKNKQLITGVVALIVGVGIGYFGAHALMPATPTGAAAYAARTGGAGFAGRTGGMGGLLSGTVAASDSGSITLDTKDGSSHVILVTPATTVQKSVSGSLTDVAVGSTIIVTGTTNSDGSVSATSIQLRPATPPATVAK
jgi:hypothetical protein